MHRSLRAAIAVLVSVAFVSAVTVETLASGASKIDALLPTTDANAYDLKFYQVWVPENASTITVEFTVGETPDCSYLHVFQRSQGLPCPDTGYPSPEYQCNSQAYDPQDGVAAGDTDTRVYDAYSSEIVWTVGSYFYIGVGRDYVSDAAKACSYTLKATVATCPTAGQTATADSSTQTCVATSEQTTSTPVTIPTLSTQYQVFKRWLPLNTVSVNVTVGSSSSDLYIYGRSGSVPSPSRYDCYTSSSITVTDGYLYNFNCQFPHFGQYFYVLIEQDTTPPSTIFVGANIEPATCSNSTGGNLCHYPVSPLSEAGTAPFSLYASDFTDNDGSIRFFYVDVPQGTNVNANATFAVTTLNETGSGYIYQRRNAFIGGSIDDGYQNLYEDETTSYIATPQDLWGGGRFLFAVQAYSGNLTVTLAGQTSGTTGTQTTTGTATATTGTATATTGSTTGTASTTGSTTAVATTGAVPATTGEPDSSASIASVSFVAVAVAVLAMF